MQVLLIISVEIFLINIKINGISLLPCFQCLFKQHFFLRPGPAYFFMSKQYTHSPQSSLLHACWTLTTPSYSLCPCINFSNLHINLLKKNVYLLLGGWSYKWVLVESVVELWSIVEGLLKWLTNQHEPADVAEAVPRYWVHLLWLKHRNLSLSRSRVFLRLHLCVWDASIDVACRLYTHYNIGNYYHNYTPWQLCSYWGCTYGHVFITPWVPINQKQFGQPMR